MPARPSPSPPVRCLCALDRPLEMGGTDHSAVAGITADEEDDPTRDLSESTEDDLIARVNEIVTVGEFYEMAPGGRVIFT